jgi:hypothetical protein
VVSDDPFVERERPPLSHYSLIAAAVSVIIHGVKNKKPRGDFYR